MSEERKQIEDRKDKAAARLRRGAKLLLLTPLAAMMGPIGVLLYLPICGTVGVGSLVLGAVTYRRATRDLRAFEMRRLPPARLVER